MIDIISTWISLFFLLLIGSSPKDTSKLVEEFENLNIVKPAKRMFLASCR